MSITELFKGFALLGAEWVMWILVVLSLISVAMIIERAIYFFGQRPDLEEIIKGLRELLIKKDYAGARKQLGGYKGVAPAIAIAALEEADHGIGAVDEAASSARIRERLRLEKNLAYLGTVGNNAPFIGLFGTVIGIIQAFHDLSLNTAGGASTVMGAISEALVATAIGLLVAIPAVASFNIFQRRIKTMLGDADALIHTILSSLEMHEDSKK